MYTMQRGEAVAVLSIVSIVGILASATLLLHSPTAQITQGQTMYETVPQSLFPIICAQSYTDLIIIHAPGNIDTYCCPEDMIGENTCKKPQRIFTR